ncbi:RNase adapter RapZ, partial [Melaminivora alkalimesophila]
QQLARLRSQGVQVRALFLDASTDTLVRRFSETRRRHPLSREALREGQGALAQTLELERELLAELREQSHVIDTSNLRPAQLLSYVKSLLPVPPDRLTLVFQSFAFKRGIPLDADYVFDVRMLPNPHYEPELRPLTGRDAPVAQFLLQQPEVDAMLSDIGSFLDRWLGAMARNHRSYVTVAIGCTGGQHRSVYLVEQLVRRFAGQWSTLLRHRELDGL